MDLRGTVALVTGGNGGLGQRVCHALAKEGAHIAVMYAQSRDQAEEVARSLTSSYQINAAAFACDITDDAAVNKLVTDVCGASESLDAALAGHMDRKPTELDPVERAVLWVGAHELKNAPDVPYRVVINEAVGLAKRFGATDSHKFVNAVLDAAARELRPHEH